MATEKQVRANQQNARKSTGPTSIVGKRTISGNRITHGILSNKLLLAGEAQEDYLALLDDLQQDLRPVGLLELSLVERIALTLWRQRRLVHAETATIKLATNRSAIILPRMNQLGTELGEVVASMPRRCARRDHFTFCFPSTERRSRNAKNLGRLSYG